MKSPEGPEKASSKSDRFTVHAAVVITSRERLRRKNVGTPGCRIMKHIFFFNRPTIPRCSIQFERGRHERSGRPSAGGARLFPGPPLLNAPCVEGMRTRELSRVLARKCIQADAAHGRRCYVGRGDGREGRGTNAPTLPNVVPPSWMSLLVCPAPNDHQQRCDAQVNDHHCRRRAQFLFREGRGFVAGTLSHRPRRPLSVEHLR